MLNHRWMVTFNQIYWSTLQIAFVTHCCLTERSPTSRCKMVLVCVPVNTGFLIAGTFCPGRWSKWCFMALHSIILQLYRSPRISQMSQNRQHTHTYEKQMASNAFTFLFKNVFLYWIAKGTWSTRHFNKQNKPSKSKDSILWRGICKFIHKEKQVKSFNTARVVKQMSTLMLKYAIYAFSV